MADFDTIMIKVLSKTILAILCDPLQRIVGYSLFWHPQHITKLSEPSCWYANNNSGIVGPLEYTHIGYTIAVE